CTARRESAADAHRADRLRILVAPHIDSGSAIREREVRYIPMRCAVECESEGMDDVRRDRIRVADGRRHGELIEARVRPVQKIWIQSKRCRHYSLSAQKTDEPILFPAYLIVGLP